MASANRLAIIRSSTLVTVVRSVWLFVTSRTLRPSVSVACGGTGGLAWYA